MPGAPTTGTGNAWADPIDLHTATITASAGDSVFVAQGTYQSASGQSFTMKEGVKIYGGFAGTEVSLDQRSLIAGHVSILQGNNSSVIYNNNNGLTAAAVLDGFTIKNGIASAGGGMHNFTASPTINNCVFSDNAASPNGGSGGGMYNREGSSPVLSNCIFSDNTASTTDYGGGGAMWNTNSSPVINNCIFKNNTAKYGGAFNNYFIATSGPSTPPASPIISNTVFVNNRSTADGAGITNAGTNTGASLTLTNVTFINNNAAGGGGAIDNFNASLTVTNSIFWGNTASAHNDIWFENGAFSINYSFTQVAWTGTGNIFGSSSPFVNIAIPAGADGIWKTADDGLTLASGSPCINAGTPDTTGLGLGNMDIAGNPRIVQSRIDLGAYEYNNVTLPITLISFTGSLYNGVANLQWHTAMESDFNHFEVEKSTDGSLFRPQGKISAKGNLSRYIFSIVQQEPRAYYRLKMVDDDGSARYSRIISLAQSAGSSMLVYPTPATNHINIKVAGAGSMSIYAADGKLVKTLAVQAGINSMDISNLDTGMYYGVMNGIQVKFIKK